MGWNIVFFGFFGKVCCFQRFSLKIFGEYKIELPQYLGRLDIYQVANAWASAGFNLDLNNGTRLNAAINNTYSICNGDTAQIGVILHDSAKLGANAYKEVSKDKTCFHLASELLKKINETKEAQRILKCLPTHI